MRMTRGIKTIVTVFVVVLGAGLIGSCNLLGGLTSHMSIDGEQHSLANMYGAYGKSQLSDNYIFYVYFTSRGLKWDYVFEGSGDFLYLRFSSRDSKLAEGTYPAVVGNWPDDEMVGEGGARVGYQADTGTYDARYVVSGGKVHVRRTLRGYDIEFELTAEDGSTEVDITGSYRGTASMDRL